MIVPPCPVSIHFIPNTMATMQVAIITPAPAGSNTGNRVTALRWAELLRQQGHQVFVDQTFSAIGNPADIQCLIALHARRSSTSIVEFHKRFPDRPLVVCLTGTDLHLDFSDPTLFQLDLLGPHGFEWFGGREGSGQSESGRRNSRLEVKAQHIFLCVLSAI